MSKLTKTMQEAKKLCAELAFLINEVEKEDNGYGFITGTAKTAAMRRKSMDLSRTLSKLRKPYHDQ